MVPRLILRCAPVALAALVALALLIAALALGAAGSASSGLSMLPGQVADIPPSMLTHYVRTADTTGIDWAILAAIGKVESDHNRSTAPGVHSGVNFAGCCAGSMQISLIGGVQSTWGHFQADGNSDGRMSVYDPADAVLTAAGYLKASGAPADYDRAIFAYNHAHWYVTKIQRIAANYRALTTTPPTGAAPWQVLASPRILLTPSQRTDIAHGLIDPRVLALLTWIAARHTITISSLRSDHSTYTTNGSISNHNSGRAVDIATVDGAACRGEREKPCGTLTLELAHLTGQLHITELIYCFDPDPTSADAFAASDHCDHIHAGYEFLLIQSHERKG